MSNQTALEHLRRAASVSFARSIFHAAEANEAFDWGLVMASAVSAYYSVFHLGSAMVLAYGSYPAPDHDPHEKLRTGLERKWAEDCERGPQAYKPDPAKRIDHDIVADFLPVEIPQIAACLGRRDINGTLRDMREFVSYAPRLVRRGETNILWSGCQYIPEDFRQRVADHLGQIETFYPECLEWLGRRRYTELQSRILSGEFVLFEFDSLREYHPDKVQKRAWALYRSMCEHQGIDCSVYRPDPSPESWRLDDDSEHTRYTQIVRTLADP